MTDSENWDGSERRVKTYGNGGSVFERHLQTGFGVIITSVTVWVGFSVIDLGKEAVKTSTQLEQVRVDMKSLQDQSARVIADRYTADQARRDLAVISLQLQKLEDRMDRMERNRR
jgi:hypothetical protein